VFVHLCLYYIFCVAYFVFTDLFVLDFVSSVLAKRFSGKIIFKMTYFVSSGTYQHNTLMSQSCYCVAVIRSGNYCMFDDIGEEELDVQTEASDEPLDEIQLEEDQKKPGPLQVCMSVPLCELFL